MSLFPFTHSFWILLPCDESRVCEEKGRERSPEDYHVMIIDIFIFHFSLLEIFFVGLVLVNDILPEISSSISLHYNFYNSYFLS